MACNDVGDANPDIGGIGIILAFAIQALLSLILSGWSFSFHLIEDPDYLSNLLLPLTIVRRLGEHGNLSPEWESIIKRWLPGYDTPHARALQRGWRTILKKEIIHDILLLNSDAQTVISIALSLTGIIQANSMTLYQYRLLYDTINFTGVSNCAAISCGLKKKSARTVTRFLPIGIFAILYLIFSIRFGIALKRWDDSLPGHCYDTARIALSNASHPYVDNIYLSITCLYLFAMLTNGLLCMQEDLSALERSSVVLVGGVQFILHLYFVIAIRLTNEPLLAQGYTENEWSFGQVFAVVMLAGTLLECVNGSLRYRKECAEHDEARKTISRIQSGLEVKPATMNGGEAGQERTMSHDSTNEAIEPQPPPSKSGEATRAMRASDEEPRDLEAARVEADDGNRAWINAVAELCISIK